MIEVIFLVSLAVIAIIFAVFQDFKTHEVANWVSFSLIIFAMGFRFFFGLFNQNFSFFYQGLIGLGVFFILGNIFFYGKVFAGGDAKLMIALGSIIPFYNNLQDNLNLFFVFIFVFLISGAIYGMVSGLKITLENRKRFLVEFKKRFSSKRNSYHLLMAFGLIVMVLGFLHDFLFLLGIFIFIFPYIYLWAKSVDESCMVRKISPNRLREGDWLYKKVNAGRKKVIPKWEGLTKEEIVLLKKHGKDVYVREGIAFTPVFLISFVFLVVKVFFLG